MRGHLILSLRYIEGQLDMPGTAPRAITYEDFGATGDGVTDDMPAICAAHAHANEQGMPVRSRPDAAYHLGARALTALIATDTDWNTSRFTIDDTSVEDHKAPLFEVRSLLKREDLQLAGLARDQERLDTHPTRDCYVRVENERRRRYIRRGLNRNRGVPQQDCFILRRDGSVEGPVDWDYDHISRLEACPIDENPLRLRGGVFTTFANRMEQKTGYNYWRRNIVITRSNTEVDGLTHYVVGETAVGHPYAGFVSVSRCANVTLRNCFATGHKIYSTVGAAGKPVRMGSYDYCADSVVNFRMFNCRMNHICDRTRWGVIATNFCKHIRLQDCHLSRMDTHMGVSGTYTVRGCTLGHMGLNAIGRGVLTVADSTLYGTSLIRLREDYGSTWDGEMVIRNCRWVPACGERCDPVMIHVRNDGMHDFGYPCRMPCEIAIDGLFVDDTNHSDAYDRLYVFSDPESPGDRSEEDTLPPERPFPFERCRTLTIRNLETASGRKWCISPHPDLHKGTDVDEA